MKEKKNEIVWNFFFFNWNKWLSLVLGFWSLDIAATKKKIKILGNYVLSFNWIIVHGLGVFFLGQQPKRRGGGQNSLKPYFITEINKSLWFRVLSFHLQLTVKQWANGKTFWVRIRCPWKWITMFWVLYFGFSSMLSENST